MVLNILNTTVSIRKIMFMQQPNDKVFTQTRF